LAPVQLISAGEEPVPDQGVQSDAAGSRSSLFWPPDVRDATPATRPDPFAFNQVGNMPQAIVDPSELRRFAQMLKKFNNEMGERMSALANQLNDLTNSWRDQEQTKFRVEFEQHMKMIARFIEANNQHIPYLLRKAERIEEYMQQR
jgi:uncharacterized protein YukE